MRRTVSDFRFISVGLQNAATMRCVNKVGSLPTCHPSLSIETQSGDVYAEANVTQMCLNCLPEDTPDTPEMMFAGFEF